MTCISEEGPMNAVLEQQATDKQPTPKSKKTTRRQPARQAQGHEPLRVLPSTRRAARATASTAPPPDPSTNQPASPALHHTPSEAPPAAPASPDAPTPGSSS